MGQVGMIRSVPWSLNPLGYGLVPSLPILANTVFWDGRWGILFALIHDKLPGRATWPKGAIIGVMVVIASNWPFLPLIRQHAFRFLPLPLFEGFNETNPMVLLPSSIIPLGFGLLLGARLRSSRRAEVGLVAVRLSD